MRDRGLRLMAATLFLGSCGGGDGDAGGSIPVVPGPTPTSTPTPTPTPTPSPTYDVAYDLSRNRSFAALGSQLTATTATETNSTTYGAIASTLLDQAQNATIGYVLASQETSLTLGNGAPRTYTQSQISLRDADRLVYTAPDGFFSLSQPGPALGGFPAALRYVLLGVQSISTRNNAGNLDIVERRFVAGSSTVASDVQRAGSASYRVFLAAASIAPLRANGFVAQDATLTINYATGAATGTITATSTSSSSPARSIALTVAGQLSTTTNRVVGTIGGPDGGQGRLTGELYGPAGRELGIAFTYQQGQEQLAGTIAGEIR